MYVCMFVFDAAVTTYEENRIAASERKRSQDLFVFQ